MNVIDITEVPMGTPNSSQPTQPQDKSFTLLHTASQHHTTSHSITTCIIHNFKFNPSNSSSLVVAMETSYSLLLGGALMLVCVQGNGMGCWLTPLGAFCFFPSSNTSCLTLKRSCKFSKNSLWSTRCHLRTRHF